MPLRYIIAALTAGKWFKNVGRGKKVTQSQLQPDTSLMGNVTPARQSIFKG